MQKRFSSESNRKMNVDPRVPACGISNDCKQFPFKSIAGLGCETP